MKAQKETAARLGQQAARKTKLQKSSYQRNKPMSSSNLKESLGELLLYLQTPIGRNKKQKGYSLLEILLMQYIETEYQGDAK
ncbi:hypothetical protein ACFLZ8_02480 [Planctomycetota bacterium]